MRLARDPEGGRSEGWGYGVVDTRDPAPLLVKVKGSRGEARDWIDRNIAPEARRFHKIRRTRLIVYGS